MDIAEAIRYGLTTFASAGAGVLAERTLNVSGRVFAPAWYHTFGRLQRRRRRTVESRMRLGMGSVFSLGRGEHELFVLEFAPQGFDPANIVVGPLDTRDLPTAWAQLPPELRPLDIDTLEKSIVHERDELERDPRAWNARRFVLRRAIVTRVGDDERPALELGFGVSDYATKLVVSREWEAMRSGAEGRRPLVEKELRHVQAGLSHTFAVNLTIETADHSIILTRRSALANQAHGLQHISMNEGMAVEDSDDHGFPDPYATAIRGVREELGVDLAAFRDRIVLHALILDVTRYEWAFVGHVDLRDTALTDAVFRMHRGVGISSDSWETDELRFLPWNAGSAAELLTSDEDWVGHGYLNLALSAIHRFPRSRAHLLAQIQRALT